MKLNKPYASVLPTFSLLWVTVSLRYGHEFDQFTSGLGYMAYWCFSFGVSGELDFMISLPPVTAKIKP